MDRIEKRRGVFAWVFSPGNLASNGHKKIGVTNPSHITDLNT